MESINEWKIKFSWVKAHAGNYGNETADRLAKEAARSHRTNYEYNRIPISAIIYDAAEEAVRKWQTEWTTSLRKGSSNKTIFSISTGEIRDENSLNHKTNSGAIGTWQN